MTQIHTRREHRRSSGPRDPEQGTLLGACRFREHCLQGLRTKLHETIDWSLDRAASLGERAQEHLGRDLESIRDQLRKRLS